MPTAVIVSNHGGRDEESLRSTIECLPESGRGLAAAAYRCWSMVASGRGTDVSKALALGASAAGIGRLQIWGLAPTAQAGVEAILDIYARELRAIMRQAGTPSIASITRDFRGRARAGAALTPHPALQCACGAQRCEVSRYAVTSP